VLAATVYALLVAAFFGAPWLPHETWRRGLMTHLPAVERVWTLASGLVSFTLSFFLTQSYTFWREVYLVVRQVQGRLNDLGMLVANGVAREADSGEFTPLADELLAQIARYVRLWNMLLYASVTTRFAPLASPSGLTELMRSGAISDEERRALLEASTGHNSVIVWLSAVISSALADGRIGAGGHGGASGLTYVVLSKLTELRSTGASIADKLSGRMPLAYTQLVQILVDLFILATPLALMHSVGPLGAVMGTALLTLFYTSILNLAKLLLDPFGNVEWSCNPVTSGISISTATLIYVRARARRKLRRARRRQMGGPRGGRALALARARALSLRTPAPCTPVPLALRPRLVPAGDQRWLGALAEKRRLGARLGAPGPERGRRRGGERENAAVDRVGGSGGARTGGGPECARRQRGWLSVGRSALITRADARL
jgi:hypothetical protein